MKPLAQLFDYTDTVSFEVSDSLAQSVSRLARMASTPPLQATLGGSPGPSLIGTVSKEYVRLHRATPFLGNIFRPIFFGYFQMRGQKLFLVGNFRMGTIAHVVVWISIGAALITQIVALAVVAEGRGVSKMAVLEPAIFIFVGLLVVLSGKASARGDVVWIKDRIQAALR